MSMDIEKQIEALSQQKLDLEKKIAELDEVNARKIVLDCLRSHGRYIYFRNNEDILYDTDDQALWTSNKISSNAFEKTYPKIGELVSDLINSVNNKDNDERDRLYSEIQNLVKSKSRSGFEGWFIPHYGFYKGIKSNLPDDWKDNDYLFFFNGKEPSYTRRLTSYEFDYTNAYSIRDLCLVNWSLWVKDYSIANLDKYSDQERVKIQNETKERKLNDRLDVFIKHSLFPVLKKTSANKQFDILCQELPPLKIKLKEINDSLKLALLEKEKQRELLSSKFDYRYLLEYLQLDCDTIDDSVVKYSEATIEWSGILLSKIAEYEMRQCDLITKSKQVTQKISGKYYLEPNLTEKENNLLADRKLFMQQRFNLDFGEVKHNVASLKYQGHNLKQKLARINASTNSISLLGELHNEVRAPFDLLAENSAMQIIDKLKQMEFYEENTPLVGALVDTEQRWSDDFKALKTSKTNSLIQACSEDGIEPGDYQQWLADWYELRSQLEECLQPLLEAGIEHRLDSHTLECEPVLMLIEALENYKQSVDEFYLSDRKGIHQEVVFQANAPMQERLAVETALYKLNVVFQQSLQKIIFGIEDIEQRLFVFYWAENITQLSVGNVVDFIKNQQLDQVSEVLLNDFAQLKLKNYAHFIDDAQVCAQEIKEQEKEYNSLMFKMRKELAKANLEAA